METITLLIEEHKNIKRVLKVLRETCLQILDHGEVDFETFYTVLDFLKNYAERHHNEEEDVLLKKMEEELDETATRDSIKGIFAEHQLGQHYIAKLENALERVESGEKDARLDIIANAVAYSDLADEHINKENNAIYTYAEEHLSSEAIEEIEKKVREIERIAGKDHMQDKYIKIIDDLETRLAF